MCNWNLGTSALDRLRAVAFVPVVLPPGNKGVPPSCFWLRARFGSDLPAYSGFSGRSSMSRIASLGGFP